MENYRETKEEIKDRMIKTALDYWNVKKVENLDPFIRLLIEALAVQLHSLSEDISDIETRAMRRLSEVLLPEALTVVHPAHAIMYSTPQVSDAWTDLRGGYTVNASSSRSRGGNNWQFYPVCRTPLHQVSVKSMVIEGNVYEVSSDQNKRLTLRLEPTPDVVGKVYIGLDTNIKNFSLENFSFYLDFPNIDNRSEYLHFLKTTTWKCNGLPLDVSSGLYAETESSLSGLPDFFSANENIARVNQEIMDYYRDRYITINTPLKVSLKDFRKVPMVYTPELEQYQQVCLQDLLWLEVDFPSNYSPSVLSDLQVCLNTFPVVNKTYKDMTMFVAKDFGVVPLDVNEGESFFDMDSVSDEFGRSYCRTYGYKENASDLTYTLRHGGCESFDQRDASELLLRLQSLLEDELSVFSSSEFAKSSENVNAIEKLLQKITSMPAVRAEKWEAPYYLFVEPPQQSTLFYVHYWTSAGASANGLHIGQPANGNGSLYTMVGQSMLITPSVGGMNTPNEREKIARFKHVLTSRNRIVTNSDIKHFCIAQLPDTIRDVKIEKGISRGKGQCQGLVRTIDVHLLPYRPIEDGDQKRQIIESISASLSVLSPMTYNYRLFID